MFAIAFDLTVKDADINHPKGALAAYADIAHVLGRFSFERKQGSVYLTDIEDMANLLDAMLALNAMPWFGPSVRDIRAFRVEQWSDFTAFTKRNA